MTTGINAASPEHEISSSRVFNVPVALLYRAWTEPEHLKNWWGPNGFTNTFHEFDLRPGGRWRLTMHGPEKGNYENEAEFIKIEKNKLLFWKRHSRPLSHVLVIFETLEEDKTNLVFKMIFDTVEECNKIKPFAVEKNEENFDRLENELKNMQ